MENANLNLNRNWTFYNDFSLITPAENKTYMIEFFREGLRFFFCTFENMKRASSREIIEGTCYVRTFFLLSKTNVFFPRGGFVWSNYMHKKCFVRALDKTENLIKPYIILKHQKTSKERSNVYLTIFRCAWTQYVCEKFKRNISNW